MESALEVLSRAATMVNAAGDTRLTINKELPTTKWRRDRRIRLSSEYHIHETATTGNIKPLGESNQTNSVIGCVSNNGISNNMEIPLDMSVSTSKPPPPPYREPLPGSQFSTMARPSVITQAPKRELSSNQENKDSIKNILGNLEVTPTTESISMVDPVIDEHFRRSLGADYMNLFGNKKQNQLKMQSTTSPESPQQQQSPQPHQSTKSKTNETVNKITIDNKSSSNSKLCKAQQTQNPPNKRKLAADDVVKTTTVAMSVDDHFAKALGETWKQLQQAEKQNTSSSSDDDNYENMTENGDAEDINDANSSADDHNDNSSSGPSIQQHQRKKK